MARRPTGQGPPPSAPNMFRLNQCTRNFTFLARSSRLFTGIFCTVISTVTPFFISLHCSAALASGQTVYECATKGQTLQTGRSKHSWQKQLPRNGKKIPRGAGEAPGQESVVGSLRHQQQSFPCTLLPPKQSVQPRRSAVGPFKAIQRALQAVPVMVQQKQLLQR